MSQHEFESVYGGRRVTVCMGWDAPLKHYFMTVKPTQANSVSIYSNLSDAEIDGGAPDPEYFWQKLAALGIECALRATIDQALRRDAGFETSNVIVRYGSDEAIDYK